MSDSLGFLTESALHPQKARRITGVGASSILSLKSLVAEKEQDLRRGTYERKVGSRYILHLRGACATGRAAARGEGEGGVMVGSTIRHCHHMLK